MRIKGEECGLDGEILGAFEMAVLELKVRVRTRQLQATGGGKEH